MKDATPGTVIKVHKYKGCEIIHRRVPYKNPIINAVWNFLGIYNDVYEGYVDGVLTHKFVDWLEAIDWLTYEELVSDP